MALDVLLRPCAAAAESPAVARTQEQALRLYAAGRFHEAADRFAAAVHVHPEYADGLYYLGHSLLASGAPWRALLAFDRYVQLRPTAAVGWLGRAEAYRALGLYGLASADFDRYRVLTGAPSEPPERSRAEHRSERAQLTEHGGATPAPPAPAWTGGDWAAATVLTARASAGPAAVTLYGEARGQGGSTGGALAGAVTGTAVGALGLLLSRWGTATAGAGGAVGAVVGYRLSAGR